MSKNTITKTLTIAAAMSAVTLLAGCDFAPKKRNDGLVALYAVRNAGICGSGGIVLSAEKQQIEGSLRGGYVETTWYVLPGFAAFVSQNPAEATKYLEQKGFADAAKSASCQEKVSEEAKKTDPASKPPAKDGDAKPAAK